MVSPLSLSFFGLNTTSTTTSFGVDASLLTAWASARAGIGATDIVEVGADPNAPTSPWTPGYTPANAALAAAALAGKAFFDPKAARYADLSMGDDYRQLFAMYQGIKTLHALAEAAEGKNLSATERARIEAAFARGAAELQAYVGGASLDGVNVYQGDRVDASTSRLGIPVLTRDYTTPALVRGSVTGLIPGLPSDAKFDIVATTLAGTEKRVTIDLAEMGSIPRSLGSIVSFANAKLAGAGVQTRLAATNLAPKTQQVKVGSETVTRAYTGPGQWALKVNVNGGERIAFEAAATKPAFYVAGTTSNGGSLIKLEDSSGAAGQPIWVTRPDATQDAVGAFLAAGFLGAGAPYQTAPASAWETRTSVLVSDGETNTEPLLRAAGEAVLKVSLEDGRSLSITTAWRAADLEAWRIRDGESDDIGMLDDLAERLTQLLHEQGVAAGIDLFTTADGSGFSIFSGDGVKIDSLTISGRSINLEPGREPDGGFVGGLRGGIFARRFETGAVADIGDLFTGRQTFVFGMPGGAKTISIDGGEDGITAEALAEKLNAELLKKGVPAAASLVEDNGELKLRIDATHGVTSIDATVNGTARSGALLGPGAWADGGLPIAAAGQPYGDNLRTYTAAAASPFLTHTGDLNVLVTVATATGVKTVNVTVSAQERLDYPDAAPGEWNALFQQRLNDALNAAGLYVAGRGGDLSEFVIAEGTGQRLQSVTVNGDALGFEASAPAFGLGGAFDARRSFTSAEAASGVSDPIAALQSDPTVSITFDTVWGQKTVSASLEPGDPRTLEAAALRLNEALAAQGYDAGVAAVALAGGGAGLRLVTGGSDTISRMRTVALGAEMHATTLDPIDAASRTDDPIGAQSVAHRASRGATILAADPFAGTSIYQAPSFNAGAWFAGRGFDVSMGQGAKVEATRAVATGPDGSIYVLADVSGMAGDQPVKGKSDVALLKYDSAGKLIFSRLLGSAQEADGFALAVSADGKVAVAGSVTGAFAGAQAGKADSFVTLFDDEGQEVWTQRRGAAGDDRVTQLAFTQSGQLIATGVTNSAMQGQSALGGQDAYVRGFSAGGAVLFTHQYGTGGADSADALLIRDAGGGAIDIYTGGVENGRGVVRSFSYDPSSGLSAGASRDLGNFHNGALTSLAHDGTALYVGGAIGADRLTVAGTARGAVAGKEGFVARMDDDLVSTGLDRASYLGSAQDDTVAALAIVGGDIYALGKTGGALGGAGAAKTDNAFLARLDAEGDVAWTRTFNAGGGKLTPASLAVDASGASALDRLGLPKGEIAVEDSNLLVDRSSLRAGDEFSIAVDGGLARRITISASETMQTLARKIASAIGAAGSARVVTENGAQRIEITPRSGRAIQVSAGREGKNALPALGLVDGVIAVKTTAKGAIRTFGLGLTQADLRLDSAEAIAKAKVELSAALSILRQAYEALANPNAKELTAEERAKQEKMRGAVPSHLTQQLANYRAALARLTG